MLFSRNQPFLQLPPQPSWTYTLARGEKASDVSASGGIVLWMMFFGPGGWTRRKARVWLSGGRGRSIGQRGGSHAARAWQTGRKGYSKFRDWGKREGMVLLGKAGKPANVLSDRLKYVADVWVFLKPSLLEPLWLTIAQRHAQAPAFPSQPCDDNVCNVIKTIFLPIFHPVLSRAQTTDDSQFRLTFSPSEAQVKNSHLPSNVDMRQRSWRACPALIVAYLPLL